MNTNGKIMKQIQIKTLVVIIVVAIGYMWIQYQISPYLNPLQATDKNLSLAPPSQAEKLVSRTSTDIIQDKSIDEKTKYTPSEAATTSDWMRRVGKLTHEERADYAHYNEATLAELAAQGDVKAMDVLSTFYIQQGDNKKAWQYAEQGAVYGLVSTIPTLALLAIPTPLTDENKIYEKIIDSMALTKTISMRGDSNLAEIIKERNLKICNSYLNTSIKLTSTDEEAINKRAQEIYSGWQKKRIELGIGEYPGVPEAVKKYMDIISP